MKRRGGEGGGRKGREEGERGRGGREGEKAGRVEAASPPGPPLSRAGTGRMCVNSVIIGLTSPGSVRMSSEYKAEA